MNCSYEQCAPINEAQCWSNIDWKAAKRYVGSLQARIVKAVKQGRKGKVKSLQWLLTHSFYAKALAVKQVNASKYCVAKVRENGCLMQILKDASIISAMNGW